MRVIEQLGLYGLIPVVVMDHADNAIPVADALEAAGLPVMEITLRTPAGLEAISRVRAQKPDFLLGAGTVLTVEQCIAVIEAGASYVVSPGFNETVVNTCLDRGVDVIPGCVTPSEIDKALAAGLRVLKFFPASTYGGINGCKALFGPYASAGISFIPTGGISSANLSEYADKPFIHAVGGGWLTPEEAVRSGNWGQITKIASAAIDQLLGYEIAHVGINLSDEETAAGVGASFRQCFRWPLKNGSSSLFCGNLELMKQPGRGTMGHLAIRTNSVNRALFYLERCGMTPEPSTVVTARNGRITFAYLKEDLGGFALHLLQK